MGGSKEQNTTLLNEALSNLNQAQDTYRRFLERAAVEKPKHYNLLVKIYEVGIARGQLLVKECERDIEVIKVYE